MLSFESAKFTGILNEFVLGFVQKFRGPRSQTLSITVMMMIQLVESLK